MTHPLQFVIDFRQALIDNGYVPVAVLGYDQPGTSAGKAPVAKGWQDLRPRTGWVDPKSTNTGILCTGLRAVDIDVDDAGLAALIQHAAERHLGLPMTARYRAGSPRTVWLYRAKGDQPQPKRKEVNPTTRYQVEILGAGQQCVAGFVHAASGAAIEWTTGLDVLPRNQLTELSEEQITAFLNDVKIILNVPTQNQKIIAHNFSNGSPVVSDAELQEIVDNLPPATCGYDEWACYISAIASASGGSHFGNAKAHQYSQTGGSLYNSATTDRKWNEVLKKPTPQNVGFLINRARNHNPFFRPTEAFLREQLADHLTKKRVAGRRTTSSNQV